MANTFGQIFKITSFGESHGKGIGGIIDGCPAGISINFNLVQKQLDRRKPGQSKITSSRNENDEVEFLSGIFDNKTLGTPIAFIIKNNDANIKDYDVASWNLNPGDLIAFNFSIIHGAPGNSGKNRRRAFSVRFIGDDATFAKRKGEVSPPFPEVTLNHGEKMNSPSFPEIKI